MAHVIHETPDLNAAEIAAPTYATNYVTREQVCYFLSIPLIQ